MSRLFVLLAFEAGCNAEAAPAAASGPASSLARPSTVRSARAAPAPNRGPAELKLATWNIEWLSAKVDAGVVKREQRDYDRLKKYADRLDADVIAFQEVDGEGAAQRVFSPERYAFHVAAGAGVQRTGFAYKKRLRVEKHADYRELDVGGLRAGVDLGVPFGKGTLRLLSLHLKSGCFDAPLTKPNRACTKLSAQLPKLEEWVDARAAENTPFAVLGDFNRRLFVRPDEPFWAEIDDGEPPEADLSSPTEAQKAKCWDTDRPHFISHIVLSKSAALVVKPGSFTEHQYDQADRANKDVLSDHCPLSIVLRAGAPDPRSAPPRAAEP